MKPHFNDDAFADLVIGSGSANSQSHLNECDDCRDEVERLESGLAAFRQAVRQSAERPPFFWAAQRTAIGARVAERSNPRGVRWAVVSTVALAALAVGMLIPDHAPVPASTNSATAAQPQIDQDELLMREVGANVMDNVADPLGPTSLIAEDLGKALQQSQTNPKGQ